MRDLVKAVWPHCSLVLSCNLNLISASVTQREDFALSSSVISVCLEFVLWSLILSYHTSLLIRNGWLKKSLGAKKMAAANSDEKLPSSEPPSSHIP